MPSAFAHALVGASLTSLLPRALRSARLGVVFALLAAAPDLDVVGLRLGIPYEHPLGHRGLTHSLFFAALTAAVSLPLWRRRLRGRAGLATALTFVALASHGVLDAFTDAGHGIGLFIPFDNSRCFFRWRPIPTSPLSIRAFLSASGFAVLANEALWVGAPTMLFLLVVAIVRKARGSERRDA